MIAAAVIFTAAAGGPALPVNDMFPGVGDFRSQEISRLAGEDWPFAANTGTLLCAKGFNKPMVYFVPKNRNGENEYPFALADDMMTFAMVNMGRQSALRPFDSFDQLYKRLFPYLSMGKRLCNQPPGAKLPDNGL